MSPTFALSLQVLCASDCAFVLFVPDSCVEYSSAQTGMSLPLTVFQGDARNCCHKVEFMKSQTLYRALSQGPEARFNHAGRDGFFINSELPQSSFSLGGDSLEQFDYKSSPVKKSLSLSREPPRKDDLQDYQVVQGSERWWAKRVKLVRSWFQRNPLNLGIDDDSVDLIKYHIRKGRACTATTTKRIQSWKHICLIFESIPASPAVTLQHPGLYTDPEVSVIPDLTSCRVRQVPRHCQQGLEVNASYESKTVFQEVKASPIAQPSVVLDPHVHGSAEKEKRAAESPRSCPRSQSEKRSQHATKPLLARSSSATSDLQLPKPGKKLSSMTLLERQNYCLLKKDRAIELQRKKREEREQSLCTFHPKRFTTPQQPSSSSTVLLSRLQKRRNIWKPKTKKPPTPIPSTRAHLHQRKRSSAKTARSPSKQAITTSGRVDVHGPGIEKLDLQFSHETGQDSFELPQETRSSIHHFSDLSTPEKGVIELQNPLLFVVDSFYRKRDTLTHLAAQYSRAYYDRLNNVPSINEGFNTKNAVLVKGVSLLIGLKEATLTEEVVNIFFDRELFSETQAREYIEGNIHRFINLR